MFVLCICIGKDTCLFFYVPNVSHRQLEVCAFGLKWDGEMGPFIVRIYDTKMWLIQRQQKKKTNDVSDAEECKIENPDNFVSFTFLVSKHAT